MTITLINQLITESVYIWAVVFFDIIDNKRFQTHTTAESSDMSTEYAGLWTLHEYDKDLLTFSLPYHHNNILTTIYHYYVIDFDKGAHKLQILFTYYD